MLILTSCDKPISVTVEEQPVNTPIPDNSCPFAIMFDNEIFYFYETISAVNLDDLIYLGEINNIVDISKMPKANLSSNFTSVGTKLYRKNENCLIAYDGKRDCLYLGRGWSFTDSIFDRAHDIDHKHWVRMVGDVKSTDKRIPPSLLIMYDGQIYTSIKEIEDVELDSLELLGTIDCCFPAGSVPSEDFSGNFINLGTELYYYDEHSIIAYDKGKDIIYLCCDENTVYTEYVPYNEIPETYTLDDAKSDMLVVFEDLDITSGQTVWDLFIEKTQRETSGKVRLAFYYTLDPSHYAPELYEEIKDDYPMLFIQDLSFDGESYTLYYTEEEKEYSYEYKYLKRFEDTPLSEQATYSLNIRYLLVNDNEVTLEQIFQSLISSQSGASIDHQTVYSKYVYAE